MNLQADKDKFINRFLADYIITRNQTSFLPRQYNIEYNAGKYKCPKSIYIENQDLYIPPNTIFQIFSRPPGLYFSLAIAHVNRLP